MSAVNPNLGKFFEGCLCEYCLRAMSSLSPSSDPSFLVCCHCSFSFSFCFQMIVVSVFDSFIFRSQLLKSFGESAWMESSVVKFWRIKSVSST